MIVCLDYMHYKGRKRWHSSSQHIFLLICPYLSKDHSISQARYLWFFLSFTISLVHIPVCKQVIIILPSKCSLYFYCYFPIMIIIGFYWSLCLSYCHFSVLHTALLLAVFCKLHTSPGLEKQRISRCDQKKCLLSTLHSVSEPQQFYACLPLCLACDFPSIHCTS